MRRGTHDLVNLRLGLLDGVLVEPRRVGAEPLADLLGRAGEKKGAEFSQSV